MFRLPKIYKCKNCKEMKQLLRKNPKKTRFPPYCIDHIINFYSDSDDINFQMHKVLDELESVYNKYWRLQLYCKYAVQ